MKYLGLLRHAKSDWDDRSTRDFDRGLNERGRAGARLMGRHIRSQGQKWDHLLASPAVRVKHTHYEVVREQAGDADAVLIAAHNPGLQDVVLGLVSHENETPDFREAMVKFPTASFAILELPIDDWSELGSRDARLVHFMRPRDLDPNLGPED